MQLYHNEIITEIINNGVGIVNYRGWGDANGWHYPEFHADDVNGLNNGWLNYWTTLLFIVVGKLYVLCYNSDRHDENLYFYNSNTKNQSSHEAHKRTNKLYKKNR